MPKTRLTPFAHAIAVSRWPYALTALLAPGLALAGPSGGNVTSGQAAITAPNAATTVINQASNSAIIQWQSFNVAQQEYVIFNQPTASAAVLNRVVGGDASTILGHLQSNGRVFLINPHGVLFGQGAQVNVGSLVASTLNIADQDFLANKFVFKAPAGAAGSVINQGSITAAREGFVVLAGDYVNNAGVITAKLGDVVLASGSAATLDMNGDGLINVVVDKAALSARAGVENIGEIAARGGNVVMTARTARELMHAAVNNSGTISAQGIKEAGGDIYLTATGGDIADSGTLDASGPDLRDGGNIQIHSDRNIDITSAAKLDFRGQNGGSARLIAGRSLNIGRGAVIDGRAADPLRGHGGFAEISGHGKLTLGSLPTLGKGGLLLLDPDSIFVYGGSVSDCGTANLCIGSSDVDSSLNSQDTMLIAGDNIEFAPDADISSQSTSGLLLGIGHTDFGGGGAYGASPLDTSFTHYIRDNATLGSGKVTFLADVNGRMASVIIGGALQAYGALDRGSVTLGNVTAGGLQVEAADDIKAGDLGVSGGGRFLQGQPATDVAAQATLSSDKGDVIINSVNLDAHANTYSFTDGAYGPTHTVSRGDAQLTLSGNNVTVGNDANGTGGNITIYADGKAGINISAAAGGKVTVVGTTYAQIVNLATESTVLGSEQSTLNSGLVAISMQTGQVNGNDFGRIRTGGIDVHGPNVGIDLRSGSVLVNSINAEAYSSPGFQQTYLAKQGNVTLVDSNFGVNSVFLMGRGGDAETRSVEVLGTTALTGPAVGFDVQAAGEVRFGDKVYVQGSGFHINGNGSLLAGAFSRDLPQNFSNSLLGTLLTSGATTWGAARVQIAGINLQQNGDNQSFAGKVTFNHNTYTGGLVSTDGGGQLTTTSFGDSSAIQVVGIGDATLSIQADGLNVTSTTIDRGGLIPDIVSAGDITIDASAAVATVMGRRTSTETVNGVSYLVTHTISDGNGGAATFGEGQFNYSGNGAGIVDINKLTVKGFSAVGSFDGGGALTLHGGAEINGAANGGSPLYSDIADYAAVDTQNPASLNGMTFRSTIRGAVNAFGVGFNNGPSSFTSEGDIAVKGHGFTVALLNAGAINTQSVDAENFDGFFSTNDPAAIGSGPALVNAMPGAGMRIQASGAVPAVTHRIYAHDDNGGNISFGVQATALSGVEIETSGAIIDTVPGFVLHFHHPLASGDGGGQGAGFPPDLALPINNITAQQFNIQFGKASKLANSTLNAVGSLANGSGFLRINDNENPFGPRVALDIGTHSTWTAGELVVQNVSILSGSLDLVSNGENIGGQDYAGKVNLEYSNLDLSALTITADLSNILIAGGGSAPPTTVTAATLNLRATKGNVDLVDSTIQYTSGHVEGDFVTVSNTQLIGVRDTETSTADQLTVIGHGAQDAFSVDIFGGSGITGTDASITANQGLVSFDDASTLLSGDLHLTASDGNINALDNASLTFRNGTFTANGHNDLEQGFLGGGVFIGAEQLSSSRTDAQLVFTNGSLVINADQVKIDHATLSGDGGSLTGSANQFFDINHARVRANAVNVTAHGDSSGDGIGSQLIADDIVVAQRFEVHTNRAIEITDEAGVYGGTMGITAPTLVLDAGTVVGIANAGMNGDTLTVTSGADSRLVLNDQQITVPSFSTSASNLQFKKDISVTAGGTVSLSGGQMLSIAGQGAPAAEGNVVISATGSVVLAGNISIGGSRTTIIKAGDSTAAAKAQSTSPGILTLNGTVGRSSGAVRLFGRDGVQQSGSLTINANALDIDSERFIRLGSSIINVGGGLAALGADPALLATIREGDPEFPLPPDTGPNASFIALEEVELGNVNFNGGHYMFVRAGAARQVAAGDTKLLTPGASFSFSDIKPGAGGLLLNFTPADGSQNLTLNPALATNLRSGLTLVLGSSNYAGDITVATADSPLTVQNAVNFVFTTKGRVQGSEFLTTNGRVAVLAGITPPLPDAAKPEADQSVSTISDLGSLTEARGNGGEETPGPGDANSEVQNSYIEYNNQSGEGKTFECT